MLSNIDIFRYCHSCEWVFERMQESIDNNALIYDYIIPVFARRPLKPEWHLLIFVIMITGNDFGTVEKERLLRKYQG